jgi:hypothetical protein
MQILTEVSLQLVIYILEQIKNVSAYQSIAGGTLVQGIKIIFLFHP